MMKCSSESCNKTNIGKPQEDCHKELKSNGGKCIHSNMTEHSVENGHALVQSFVLTQIQSKNKDIRKIAETFLIQKYKPTRK